MIFLVALGLLLAFVLAAIVIAGRILLIAVLFALGVTLGILGALVSLAVGVGVIAGAAVGSALGGHNPFLAILVGLIVTILTTMGMLRLILREIMGFPQRVARIKAKLTRARLTT
ncbi:hypothetical protein [Candidatus Igneacidithiobacillus taiwanensis]|uniref:hypothetical protein n=1 Tax=Candidatus Igneacidithiobacillus taiwanensis TaxID=1945924 RepID=UPI0028A26358|nr:hypothetical protein [Candidatus Igneacidithiobacillus taiwanensis]